MGSMKMALAKETSKLLSPSWGQALQRFTSTTSKVSATKVQPDIKDVTEPVQQKPKKSPTAVTFDWKDPLNLESKLTEAEMKFFTDILCMKWDNWDCLDLLLKDMD